MLHVEPLGEHHVSPENMQFSHVISHWIVNTHSAVISFQWQHLFAHDQLIDHHDSVWQTKRLMRPKANRDIAMLCTIAQHEIFFCPNIPPLFQLLVVALFLAVAILGMCSRTTDSNTYVHNPLASYRWLDKSIIWNGRATLLFNVWWVLSSLR